MTFSANPARQTLRERLRRLAPPQRALFNALATAAVLVLATTLLALYLVRAVAAEQAQQLGNSVATVAAERAAEYLAHNDLVSLKVITDSLEHMPGVVGVTVYDRNQQPLAQSGQVQPLPELLRVATGIVGEDREPIGSVELLIDRDEALPALHRFDWTMLGWLGFTAILLLIVARLQRELLAGAAPAQAVAAAAPVDGDAREEATDTPEAPAEDAAPEEPALPDGPLLRVSIVNLATLEQRLAPRALAELVALYEDVMARACAIYQGRPLRTLADECLVSFPGAGDDETLFRAICCAQLFFGVVRDMNNQRRSQGRLTLQFKAALHHDTTLDNRERAIVTWEICQHGSPGRLTITDLLSEHPVLGERLVLDNSARQLLQIELPGTAEGASRLQDVLALGVVQLAEPYEELLARQVRHLCAAAA